MTFEELNIIPPILNALKGAGYQAPTPIQEKAIPPVLDGRDLLGCAQTGTGKTAAFAVPILQLLQGRRAEKGKRPIRALVLTPTRELALQIYENFEIYGKHLNLRAAVIFGGVGQGPQVDALQRGIDILVATPGRLNDLIGQGYVSLERLEIFVLDEADRMLDMGFIHDVKKVIAKTPKKKQTLLFSATMPPEIQEIADDLLHNLVRVEVDPPASTVEAIRQYVYFVDKANKRHLLTHLLQNPELVSVLVFTRTKHGADRVARDLARAKISAKSIHGDKSQGARQAALSAFKEGSCRVLVATDIAARGIDIEELSHVINYDIPEVPETYVHRIGRTGRAGMDGTAISFCTIDEMEDFRNIQKLTGGRVQEVQGHPWPMEILTPTPKAERGRRGRGRQEQPARQEAKQEPQPQQKQPKQENRRKEQPQAAARPARQAQPKKAGEEGRKKEKQREKKNAAGKQNASQPSPRQYSEQMTIKPSQRHPKKYEYRDTTRLKDDIITYTPDWGSPPSAPRFQPSASSRKKPQDQPLSDKPFRR
ncbi:MAG TPA: DEAD/DEAH box helicase [Candidatus Caccousia avistercoris]|nr:DEAD/DEAH box helicase [Candidatus Caccousia avistercoris]